MATAEATVFDIARLIAGENRIVVCPHEAAGTSPAGIYIPDEAREKPCTGEIVTKDATVNNGMGTGDTVLFSKYAGSEIVVGGTTYIVMKADDVLAYFPEDRA